MKFLKCLCLVSGLFSTLPFWGHITNIAPPSYLFLSPFTCLILGYFIGSIPSGYLLVRLTQKKDIRRIGSGNIGATNVLRTGSKKIAALTLLFDALKGCIAVSFFPLLLEGLTFPSQVESCALFSPPYLLALGAFAGHLHPLWLDFKGGKGIATALGIFLGLSWKVGLVTFLIWIVTVKRYKYSSLGGITAAVCAPLLFYLIGPSSFTATCMILSAWVLIRHKDNLRRLYAGSEPKVGAS